MKTTTIWLDQCIPGMRIAETVMNSFNAVVVNIGTVLDANVIEKLKNINYQKLRVYVDNEQRIVNSSFEVVRREYADNLDMMKDVLHNLTSGKGLDMTTIANVSNIMIGRQDDIVGILACLNQVRAADEYTYAHSLNVAFISLLIAKWMNYAPKLYNDVLEAGLLHDVGKSLVPGEILNKPARLTDDEFTEMKKHTLFGYKILSATPEVLPSSALAALEHHEKLNGSGYPLSIGEKKIHPFGKIVAIADIYDAMTSNRVYRRKTSPFEVFKVLEDLAFVTLDPAIVLTFLQNLAGYYIGDRALLSDGRSGLVVFINPRAISRPVVQTDHGVVDLDDASNKNLIVTELT